MLSRYTLLGILLICVTTTASTAGLVYGIPALFPSKTAPVTIIHIPRYSSIPPPGWQSFQNLSSPTFHFPVNITVVIGVNNTIRWINDDPGIGHTVTSFQVPSGAATFNSQVFTIGQTFTVTLTVPGVYKYFCAWHNWLAGVITVKPA